MTIIQPEIQKGTYVSWVHDNTEDILFLEKELHDEDSRRDHTPEEIEDLRRRLEQMKSCLSCTLIAVVLDRFHDVKKLKEREKVLEKFLSFGLGLAPQPEVKKLVADESQRVDDYQHDSLFIEVVDVIPCQGSLIDPDEKSENLGIQKLPLLYKGKPFFTIMGGE